MMSRGVKGQVSFTFKSSTSCAGMACFSSIVADSPTTWCPGNASGTSSFRVREPKGIGDVFLLLATNNIINDVT